MTEQFIAIIEKANEKELISFLQTLPGDQKKKLAPEIKKLAKEYSQFGQTGANTYGHTKGTDAQRNMLQLASFVCFNKGDYLKSPFPVWILEKEKLSKVIDWYCPDWFSDFVNKQAESDYIPHYISYEWVMELTEKGVLQPSKELLARILSMVILEHNRQQKWIFQPEKLLIRPITLQEHIWYLFDVQTSIHGIGNFYNPVLDGMKDPPTWLSFFTKYANEYGIDREKLLKESLLASNKNFNKNLSGWFAELFIELQPANGEIMLLQKELISVLSSPHSKPVNTALQMIKKISGETMWNIHEFLDTVLVLLAADTKVTVTSALMILEKIAKKNKEYRERIAVMVCQTFVHPDPELQTRAAKLIMANHDSLHESFHEELAAFHDSMLASAKKILENIFTTPVADNVHNPSVSEIQKTETGELTEIPAIENTDDLIFIASQVFDNNASWHFDHLAAALVKFRARMKPADIPRLEPAFQRAFGLVRNDLRSEMGYIDQLLAMFFIDFGIYLIRNFPMASETVKQIFRKYDYKDGNITRSWTVSPENSSYTQRWTTHGKIAAYEPHKQLLIAALEKIHKGDDMPVLSAPTHTPSWIMPKILIERLCVYQQNNREPDGMDLQVAISRCYLENPQGACLKAHEKLSGEFREIMLFVLDQTISPKGPFLYKAAWMVASLTRKEKKGWSAFESFSYYKKSINNYTGQLEWESVEEPYESKRYDYQTGKYVTTQDKHKKLRVLEDHTERKGSGFKKLFSGLLSAPKEDPPLLYDFLKFKTRFLSVEHNDIKRIMLLTPNNPGPLLAEILNQCLQFSTFYSETDKRLVIAALQVLHEIWDNYGEMAHVFIATCMITSDKTVANIAAEIWINAVTNNKIDNEKLGQVIGIHERIEFAPLKRFTDLVTQQLFRVSDKHNRALKLIVENILKHLSPTPITNLKKLLEIYQELLHSTNSLTIDPAIMHNLTAWEKTDSLKKVAGSIREIIQQS